jgi:hypothetical protein
MGKCIIARHRLRSNVDRSYCASFLKFSPLFVLGVSLLTGCGTVCFDVPEGRQVKLLEVDAPTSITIERTIWYAWWGADPLGDNHTASIIQDYDLKEVKMHTLYSASDSIINTFTNIVSLSRRRIVVEGNSRVKAQATP